MQTGQAQGRLLSVAGAFLFPAVPPLAATQNAKMVLQWFRSLNLYHLSVFRNDGGKVTESKVDSAGRAFHWSRVWYFFLHRQAYEPAVSLTSYRRRQDAPLNMRHFLQANLTKTWQLHRPIPDVDRSC